jgi:hypothetical protein
MSTIREQIGLLKVIGYLAALIAWVIAMGGGGGVFPFVAGLIMVALPFALWWEIRNMEQENDPSHHPRQAIAKKGSVSQGQTVERLATTETTFNGNNRVYPPSVYPDDPGRYAERNFA